MTTKAQQLAQQLRNVGPKLAERLVAVGIDAPEALKAMGAQAAYLKMYEEGDAYGDFNAAYLYALEGAIRDCDWLEIPAAIKSEHQAFARSLQARKNTANNKNKSNDLD